jgi:hypothetical protein
VEAAHLGSQIWPLRPVNQHQRPLQVTPRPSPDWGSASPKPCSAILNSQQPGPTWYPAAPSLLNRRPGARPLPRLHECASFGGPPCCALGGPLPGLREAKAKRDGAARVPECSVEWTSRKSLVALRSRRCAVIAFRPCRSRDQQSGTRDARPSTPARVCFGQRRAMALSGRYAESSTN